MDTTVTPSREQTIALFAEAAKGMTPAEPREKTLAELLAPYARVILKYRSEGYSAAQLVAILKTPKIGITLSEASLRKYLTAVRKRASHRARKAKRAAPAKAPVATSSAK